MDYQVSARKFRPGRFDDLIGQTHVVQTLRNAILQRQVAHAYLFSGMRGVGKTTAARILAKGLNCEQGPTPEPCGQCASCLEITHGHSVDVIEIDGASNTGVDDVRELRENVKFSPFRGAYRIYIIDEVHMLSNSAFNALLKTLEEPPSHAVFVFATTEAQKIPATITSRCQHFNFRRIPRLEIMARLHSVAQQLDVTVDERSLGLIARASEGSLRDALSVFDQAVAFGGTAITERDVEVMLGAVPDVLVRRLVDTMVNGDPAAAVALVGEAVEQGHDLRTWCGAMVERMRHLMIAAVVSGPEQAQGLMDVPGEEVERVMKEARSFSVEQLQELFHLLTQAEDRLRLTSRPRFVFEVAAVRAAGVLQRTVTSPTTDAPRGQPHASPPVEQNAPGAGAPRLPSQASASSQASAPAQHGGKPGPPPAGRSGEIAKGASPRQGTVPSQAHEAGTPSAPPARKPGPPPAGRPGEIAKGASPRQGTASSQAHEASAPPARPAGVTPRPTPAPAATRKPPSPAGSPVMRQEDWARVVETMIGQHPNVGSFLERGRVVTIEDNQVVVGFAKSVSLPCSVIQKDANRALIEQVCRDVTGAAIRLRVVELTEEPGDGGTIKQMRETQQKQDDEALLERVREHPVVKHTKDLFDVEVVKASREPGKKEA